MSWNVEMVEILNKENDFEGEEWWAVTDDNKIENTFEVRNKDIAMDLCTLLNNKDSKIKELGELSEENDRLRDVLYEADRLIQQYLSIYNRKKWEKLLKNKGIDITLCFLGKTK
nr:hypothetical protein [uncultured Methanobrevibacter sp.]